jgi:hypothetical protein
MITSSTLNIHSILFYFGVGWFVNFMALPICDFVNIFKQFLVVGDWIVKVGTS